MDDPTPALLPTDPGAAHPLRLARLRAERGEPTFLGHRAVQAFDGPPCPACRSQDTRSVRTLHAETSFRLSAPSRTRHASRRSPPPGPPQADPSFFMTPPAARDEEIPTFAAWLCVVLAPLLTLFAVQDCHGLWGVIAGLVAAGGVLRHVAERHWLWNRDHHPRLQAAWARIHRCQRCSTVFEARPATGLPVSEP